MNKGLEAYKKFCDDVNACVNSGGIHYIDIRNKEIIEKELKALEVIKKMFNDGNYLVRFNGYSYYIWDNVLMATSCEITKEQYDLLKEVLL